MEPGQTALMRMPRGVFESRGLGQAEDPVLRRVIGSQARIAYDAAERRAIDDRAAAIAEHLPELMLHAVPHAAKIDRDHPVPLIALDFRRVDAALHDAGVVEGGVEAPEPARGSLQHRGHLGVIGKAVSLSAAAFTGSSSLPARTTAAAASEGACGRKAYASAGSGHKRDLAFEP
jgi:hypothetical protein